MDQKNKQQAKCGARCALDCYQTVTSDQLVRMVWKKQNKYVDACPSCFQYLQYKDIKEMNIGLKELVQSGYYEKGAREIDFKSYLEKWTKKQKDQI